MKKMMVALLAGAMLFGLGGIAQATLITNGGFEILGTSIGNGLYTAPGWTISDTSNGTGIFTPDPAWNSLGLSSHSGAAFAWGGAYNSAIGSLSQIVSTDAGQSYVLDFWLANTGGTPNSFLASWNGNNLVNLSNTSNFTMIKYEFSVVGTGNDTLKFAFNQEPGAWALDDVSLAPVPEPGTMMLLGVGMLGLAVFGKRRMNKEA
ncbi:MAG: PEP-CTERM sorting domain-containing protein [Desulfuromonadaceae bacterium]